MRKCSAQLLRFMFKVKVTFQRLDACSSLCDYLKTSEATYEKACPMNDLDCFFYCQGYYKVVSLQG